MSTEWIFSSLMAAPFASFELFELGWKDCKSAHLQVRLETTHWKGKFWASSENRHACMGIDPQIGVKFCNFRTQKAVFLDHFVSENISFIVAFEVKKKKIPVEVENLPFESATMPMGAPEVNLPENIQNPCLRQLGTARRCSNLSPRRQRNASTAPSSSKISPEWTIDGRNWTR